MKAFRTYNSYSNSQHSRQRCDKNNADGSFKKLRSRLVAKENEQEERVDYLETYSPVVRMASVRTILHIATVLN